MWTEIRDSKELEKALTLAKGSYQRGLLLGYENLSGSSLKGRARHFSGRYYQSRKNLLNRMQVVGIIFHEEVGEHNRRILVIGE